MPAPDPHFAPQLGLARIRGQLPSLGLLLLLTLVSGCTQLEPQIAPSSVPRSGAHLYVTRPFQAIPEPDEFVKGVLTAWTEQLVLGHYFFAGVSFDPGDETALLTHLARINQTVPGTAGIHVTVVETPIVIGFGKTYVGFELTVYDPKGQIIMRAEPDPPERDGLRDLLLPRRGAGAEGRRWGRRAWEQFLSFLFPRRDPARRRH